MSTESFLDRSIRAIKKAIEEDRKKNYPEAYKLYQDALDRLTLALNYERDGNARALIYEKIRECTTRVEALKDYLIHSSGERRRPSHHAVVVPKSNETTTTRAKSYLDWAIETVKKAVDEDVKQNYTGAYKLYQDAVDHFRLALNQEIDERAKTMIKSKLNEYFARVQTLKEFLSNSPEKGGIGYPNGGGMNHSATGKYYLDHAIETVRRAIEQDHKHNYAEAYKLYQNSLDNFRLALKYEQNEKSRELIKAKINEYFERVEKLKERSNK